MHRESGLEPVLEPCRKVVSNPRLLINLSLDPLLTFTLKPKSSGKPNTNKDEMPRTLSVEEYKELGKRYYGRKDYERARDAFTDGIDASTGRDIQLYDYRAATFDKLGDSSSALADARFMIKNFERDPKVSQVAHMSRAFPLPPKIGG